MSGHPIGWWADKVGRSVIFRYHHGEEVEGVVSSVGPANVFVRFGSRPSGEACDPSMLRLSVPVVGEEP